MKIMTTVLSAVASFTATVTFAQSMDIHQLQDSRQQITKRYILDLQHADYKDIISLFEKNGIVVSTSRGKMNAKEFFYSFLPNIDSATTSLQQVFVNQQDANHLAARFHFSFTLKDGEAGSGEYIDEFVFADNSSLLRAVYMFENLKFDSHS